MADLKIQEFSAGPYLSLLPENMTELVKSPRCLTYPGVNLDTCITVILHNAAKALSSTRPSSGCSEIHVGFWCELSDVIRQPEFCVPATAGALAMPLQGLQHGLDMLGLSPVTCKLHIMEIHYFDMWSSSAMRTTASVGAKTTLPNITAIFSYVFPYAQTAPFESSCKAQMVEVLGRQMVRAQSTVQPGLQNH